TFKDFLNEYEVIYISSHEKSFEEMIVKVKQAESKNIPIIIFMHTWDLKFFQEYREKLSNFYLVVNEGERPFEDNVAKQIVFQVNQMNTIKLKLVLIHPDNTKKIVNTHRWLEKADFFLHHHLRMNNTGDF